MKRYFLLALLPAFLLCQSIASVAAKWEKLPTKEERNYSLTGFNRVVLTIPAELKIRQTDEYSLKGVSKYKGALDVVSLSIKDSTLYITWKDDGSMLYRNSPKVEFFLTLPELVRAELKGLGDIDLRGAFTGKDMTIALQGSGDFEVERLTLTGALRVTLTGRGDLDFKRITAERAEMTLQGSGDIEGEVLECEGALDTNLRGSGTIKIKDSRANTMRHNLQGSGDVKLTNVRYQKENQVELVGSGDFVVSDCAGEGKTNLRLRGSGDMRIANLNAAALDAELVMSGTMRILDGRVPNLTISLMGSGDMLFKGMKAQKARVWRKGSGDVELYVTDKLYIDEASGSGALRYVGSPAVMVKR